MTPHKLRSNLAFSIDNKLFSHFFQLFVFIMVPNIIFFGGSLFKNAVLMNEIYFHLAHNINVDSLSLYELSQYHVFALFKQKNATLAGLLFLFQTEIEKFMQWEWWNGLYSFLHFSCASHCALRAVINSYTCNRINSNNSQFELGRWKIVCQRRASSERCSSV